MSATFAGEGTPKRHRKRRTIGFMPLEPRVMYDGAAAATAAATFHHHAVDHDHHPDHYAPAAIGAPAAQPTGAGRGYGAWRNFSGSPDPMPMVTDVSAAVGGSNRAIERGNPEGAGDALTDSATHGSWHQGGTNTDGPANDAPIEQVVFIDSQVPDLQDLVNGVKPGELVFVINSNQDGLQQIADILAANHLTNLSAVSIVGHGQQGEFTLGSTDLTDANLASEAQPLAAIGQALAPGGDILLYGCDTAQGAAGLQFISDFSAYAGGHGVAASTQDIGTLQGSNGTFENWTLDASTGAIDASVPFTAAALDNYRGLLAGTTVTASAITTTLTVDADNDGGISPGDTVTSEVTITNSTSTAATGVAFSETLNGLTEATDVTITPIAVNDSYTLTGNTPITENAANGVLANDIDFNGDSLTVSAVNGSAANVGTAIAITDGTLTLNSDGSFTFTPTTGFSGTTSFTYTAHDAAGNSDQTATVTLTVTAPIWYVDSAASTSGMDGSYSHPYTTIAAAVSAAATDTSSGVDNIIFVENAGATYSASSGITLAQGEELLGDGSSLTEVNGNSVGLSATNPTFSVSSGNAVTLNSGNTISGINISNTGSGDGIVDDASSIGTLTMSAIAVSTGSGTAISLSHGGTVDITGTGNTINSSTGTALDVTNTDIGSSGITFESISSGTGGSASNDGIILDDTGSSGGLTVTGDGSTAGSGGTIESKTGTTGGATNGIGIYLNTTADVSLAYMQLDNLSYDGIYGQSVTNFSMDHTTVNGANGSAVGEGSVILGSGEYAGQTNHNGVTGTVSITNSVISGGYYDNLDVFDQSGTANVTLNNDTFGDNNATHGNQNVYIDPDGTSVINATVTNSNWTGVAGGSNFYFDVNSTSTTGSNLSFTGNTVGDNLGGVNGDNGSGIVEAIASSESGSTTTFDIENNSINNAVGISFIIVNDLAASPTTNALLDLTFNNNTIGTAAGASSGGAGGLEVEFNGGTLDASVTNNKIFQAGGNGIDFTGGIGVSSGNENGTLNAEITGNTYEDPSASGTNAGALQDGIYIDGGGANPGSSDNYVFNVTIGGTGAEENTIQLTSAAVNPGGSDDITLAQDDAPAINLTAENGSATSFNQYSGPGSDSGNQVETFLSTYNSTPDGNVALYNTGTGFTGGDPSAEAPATGPIFGTPSISGTDTEGDQLTASSAAALGASSTTYQWQESFSGSEYVDIFGATSSSYTLTEAQAGATIRVVATSTYSDGLIDTADSTATGTVADHLTLTTPAISGTDAVGQILTASTPTSDNSDATITYQWEENSGSGFTTISGATGQTFRVTSAQVGDTIDVVATAIDPHGGDVSETSSATATVTAFSAQSLSNASIGTLPGNDAVTVSWQATVNAQSDQLIVNPTYTNGSVTGSNFTTVTIATTTVALDTLSLEGEIFDDANGNGLASGQSGINGVSLSVFVEGSSTALESTTTDGSGDYDFTGLAAGNYYVEVTVPAGYGNSSPVRDTTPNDYLGGRNYGLAISGGIVSTNAITIAYDSPHPTGATTYPGDDTTDTLDIGLTKNPVIGDTGNTVQYYQSGSAQALDGTLTLTDAVNVDSATASISSGFLSGDTLNFTNQNGITGSYDASTGVLTLSGTTSAANYQTALDSITYSFSGDPTNAGADKTRTVSWSVSDTNSQTTIGSSTTTLDVFALPILMAGGAGTPTETTNSGPVVADSTLSITDYNGTSIHNASVQITSGDVSTDTLTINGLTSGSINNGANGTITYSFSGSTLTLTGTDTVADYQAALELVKFNAVSPNSGTRTLSWIVNDQAGGNTNNSATLQTQVEAAFGPVITAGGTATFDGGSTTPVALDGTLTVTDANSTTLDSATVSISTGFLNGDTLNFTNQNNITGVYDAATGVLTLTGTSSVANYQTALDSITYSFSPSNDDPTGGGGDTSRTINWSASDSTLTSPTATSTLDTVHVAPTVTAGGTVTFDGGGSAVTLDGTLTLSDGDSGGNLTGATVSIGTGFTAGDLLNFTTQNGITGVYDAATGVLTLTGTDTLAHYQTALDSITYSFSPSNGDPTAGGGDTTRTIDWTVTDGSTSNGTSNTATSTLDTVHVAPTVTAGGTVTFDGGGAQVTLDGTLTVSDGDSGGNLSGATVSIGTGFTSGDTLNFINQSGITGAYDAATGVLTLTGTSSIANYQAALDSITYSFSPSNGDPTAGGSDTTRTIDWTVTDGSTSNGTSNTATSTLDTMHVAPTVTAGATATFDGGGSAVTLDGTLTVSDVDSGGNLAGATVSISTGFLSGDLLNFTNQSGISGSYDAATGVLTLSGTSSIANYQTALDSITYSFSPSNGDPTGGGGDTSRTISWTVSDTSATSSAVTSALDVVHTAPTATAGATATFDGGGSPVTLDGTMTLNDPDSAGNLAGATVSISTGFLSGDTLNFTNQNGISGVYNTATGVLTLGGTSSIANYQTALNSITYGFSPSNGDPTAGGGDTARTISWTVTDGSTSDGTSNTAASTLDTVHVAPVATVGGTVTFDGGGSAITLDSMLTLTDIDSGGTLSGATVSISSGFLSGDTLNFTNQSGISGSYDAAHGILTLSGTSSIANYQTALDSISYGFSPSNGDPTGGGGDTARTISWAVTDGSTSNGTSNTGTSTLDTVHVAPAVTAGGTVTFTQDQAPAALDGTIALADLDSVGNLTGATVQITSGFLAGDMLNFTNQNGIAGHYEASTGVLTLTGTSSLADYQAALASITFGSTSPNPSNDGADLSRTISWSMTDGNTSNGISATVTSTVDIHAVPTVVAGNIISYQAGATSAAIVLDPAVGTYDATNLTGATISIANGFASGDTLSANTAGTPIHASYNAASGVLTLTGNATSQQYDQVLQSIAYSSTRTSNGALTIDWQITDQNNVQSAVATSELNVTAGFGPSVPGGSYPGLIGAINGFFITPLTFFETVTNIQGGGGPGVFGGQGFGFEVGLGGAVHPIFAEIDVTIAADGVVDFTIPLGALEASLDGDIVSVTATLADGQPLPSWLHFDAASGKFAGVAPPEITGGIPQNGGLANPHSPGATQSETLAIQVIGRDSKGDLSIIEFTISLKPGGTHHTWNVPNPRGLMPGATDRHHAMAVPQHELMHLGDRSAVRSHILEHPQAPHGRPGLSAQLDTHGWRGMHADRLALLESLRHVAGGGH